MIVARTVEQPTLVIEEVTDPVELAKAEARQEKFDRNYAWFKAHLDVAYADANWGRYICISGEELFVADAVLEAIALAKVKHPDDDGRFFLHVPREKVVRIYAHTQ